VEQIPVRLDDADVEMSAAIVRSWCACELCGETRTGLRWASFTDVPTDLTAASIEQTGNQLSIRWSDGHESEIDLELVKASAAQSVSHAPRSVAPIVETLKYADVVGTDAGLYRVLDNLISNGVAHISGGPTEPDSTATFAELFGPIHVTSYGKVQVFITSPDARTAAHTGAAQHPHTDEPYRYSPPGYLFFHSIVSAPDGEGTSKLADGFAAAEMLRDLDPAAFSTLTDVPVLSHRQHEDEVRFATRSRVISLDDDGEVQAIRINMRCLAPLDPFEPRADEVFHAITEFCKIIEDPENQTLLHLNAGDFLIFDNNRTMHGRTVFSDSSARHLHSCHVDKDAMHSTYRLLADKLQRPVSGLAQGPVT